MSSTKKNIVLQTTYQVSALLLPFITNPYVARVLGSEQVGIYSYMHSIVNYFMIFILLGLDYHGNRSIAKVRGKKEEVNRVFTEVFCSHLIPSALAVVVYFIYCFQLTGIYRTIALIQFLYLVGEVFNVNWLFSGLAEFKVTVFRNIIVKTSVMAAIFLFVRDEGDLLVYITIMALGTFASLVAVWLVVFKYARFTRVSWKASMKHLKPMSILFVAALAVSINQMIDKTMLGALGEFAELGCYEYADKLISIPLTVVTSIGLVMLSKSSNEAVKAEGKLLVLLERVLGYITLLSSLVIFGLLLYRRPFVDLYFGDGYAKVASILTVLAFSFVFMAWNSVLRTQYFMPKNLDKYYVVSVWAGAVINIGLNIVLIPRYSGIGAAIATDLSFLSITLVQLFFARKEVALGRLIINCASAFGLGLIPFLILFPLQRIWNTGWVSLILQIVMFTVLFGGVTLVYWKIKSDPILKGLFRIKAKK